MQRLGLAAFVSVASVYGAAAATGGLTETSVKAFVADKNDAIVRQDWPALQKDYLPTAQIVGLYYDRSATPHTHNGPADADVTATAALMTKRPGYTATSAVTQVFISPGGQRATVTVAVIADYGGAGGRVHRVFDDTMILELTAGQPRIAQDINLERPPR